MILSDIWPEMFFFSAVATGEHLIHATSSTLELTLTAVAVVTDKTDADLAIGNQLLTVGGVILGLVISFRTSSAYERSVYQLLRNVVSIMTLV
jgi:predicted membrane chloride channel (bestrophin family)